MNDSRSNRNSYSKNNLKIFPNICNYLITDSELSTDYCNIHV